MSDEPQSRQPPSRRAHRIASQVFGVAGIILVVSYFLGRGWAYGWMILGLGILSCVRAVWHGYWSRFAKP